MENKYCIGDIVKFSKHNILVKGEVVHLGTIDGNCYYDIKVKVDDNKFTTFRRVKEEIIKLWRP